MNKVILPRKIKEIKEGIQKTLHPISAEKHYNYFIKQFEYVRLNGG